MIFWVMAAAIYSVQGCIVWYNCFLKDYENPVILVPIYLFIFDRIFILVSLFMTYFGTCSVYTVIVANNILQVCTIRSHKHIAF